jgi:hypothetical protein
MDRIDKVRSDTQIDFTVAHPNDSSRVAQLVLCLAKDRGPPSS